jgi:hypothetical protein
MGTIVKTTGEVTGRFSLSKADIRRRYDGVRAMWGEKHACPKFDAMMKLLRDHEGAIKTVQERFDAPPVRAGLSFTAQKSPGARDATPGGGGVFMYISCPERQRPELTAAGDERKPPAPD